MNALRRKALGKIQYELEEIKVDVEALKEEEESYFDNIPDNLMYGEKYNKAEEAIDNMEQAIENIDTSINDIEVAVQ